MKQKEQKYFKNEDAEFVYPLSHFIHDAQLDGLKEITLVEAVPADNDDDYIWCMHYGETTEKSLCKKSECPNYHSKSGRGKCDHKGNLFYHGKEVKITVNQII